MAYSTYPKTRRDGTITFADNAAAHTLTVAYEEGNLNTDIPMEEVLLYLDRGEITDPPIVRHGDDQPMTFSFTALVRDLNDAAVTTLENILTNSGFYASDWVSTMGATHEVQTVTLTWTLEGTTPDGADHTMTLPYCRIRGSFAEGQWTTMTVNGISYATKPSSVT